LGGSFTPIADTARLFAGTAGYVAITIAAMLAFVTTANAGIMSAARYPLALGRDNLLPPVTAKVNKAGSPTIAIILTGLVILFSLLLDIEKLVKVASAVVITSYILAAFAVLVMRKSKLTNYRPSFRVPFCPWLPLFGIGCFMFLIYDMGLAAMEISLGLILFGGLTYWFYGRKRTNIDYALLHIAEGLINRKLSSNTLEKELYEIIHERDEMKHDAFDKILETAITFDLEPGATKKSLLDAVAQMLEKELTLSKQEIQDLFIEREAQGSCVLTPFVAIPHIIIKGENLFKILLVRSREGILFEDDLSVKAFFVIVGTSDMRNMHLRALAAIAHLVQHPTFEKQWLSAKNEAQLKDILLLGERIRMVK
jgi:amino acid transporter